MITILIIGFALIGLSFALHIRDRAKLVLSEPADRKPWNRLDSNYVGIR